MRHLVLWLLLLAVPLRAADLTVNTSPSFLATGDLHTSGFDDVAVACYGGNEIDILQNNGNGVLTLNATISGVTAPYAIGIGQLHRDIAQQNDIIVSNYTQGMLSIFYGHGDGTFDQTADVTLTCGTTPTAIALGDWNGDGRTDIAVACQNKSVWTYLQQAGGGFTTNTTWTAAAPAISIASGAFTTSTTSALAITYSNTATFDVYTGDGNGNFTRVVPPYLLPAAGCAQLSVGQLDKTTTQAEVVAPISSTNQVAVLFFNPDLTGTVSTTRSYFLTPTGGTTPTPVGAVVQDINLDMNMDVTLSDPANQQAIAFVGDGAGGLTQAGAGQLAVTGTGIGPYGIAAGHFRGLQYFPATANVTAASASILVPLSPLGVSIDQPTSTVTCRTLFVDTIKNATPGVNITIALTGGGSVIIIPSGERLVNLGSTPGGVAWWDSSNQLQWSGAGSANQLLVSGVAAAPTWKLATSANLDPAAGITDGQLATPYIEANGGRTWSADQDVGAHRLFHGGYEFNLATGNVTPNEIYASGPTASVTVGCTLTSAPLCDTRLTPPGTIVPYSGFTAPYGWLFCDGTAVSRTAYANLETAETFTITCDVTNGNTSLSSLKINGVTTNTTRNCVIGTAGQTSAQANIGAVEGAGIPNNTTITAINATTLTMSKAATGTHSQITVTFFNYGNGDSSSTFGLPDLRGRGLAGKDDMNNTSAAGRISSTSLSTPTQGPGAAGGADTHTLSSAEMPVHSHSGAGAQNFLMQGPSGLPIGSGASNWGVTGSTANAGSGGSHSVWNPNMIVNWIIKY